jgi:hypothetical protein
VATTVSIATVLVNAAQLGGFPAFSSGTNTTEAQAVRWVQEGLASLQALQKQKLGSDRAAIESIALSTQVGVNFLSLPSDAIDVQDVIWSKDSTTSYRLSPANDVDVEPVGIDAREWVDPPKYRLEGGALLFYPCPDAVHSISIWFTGYSTISTSSDSVQGALDWQKWLTNDLAIKCLIRKRRLADAASLQSLQDSLTANLFSNGRRRQQAGPHRIGDVDSQFTRDFWRWR